jgi:hypothetical protein
MWSLYGIVLCPEPELSQKCLNTLMNESTSAISTEQLVYCCHVLSLEKKELIYRIVLQTSSVAASKIVLLQSLYPLNQLVEGQCALKSNFSIDLDGWCNYKYAILLLSRGSPMVASDIFQKIRAKVIFLELIL